uniref:Uncharacterized protein n=1 Tax=Glossina pallidipes TaxID=7398 RepID=A0A1A9ZWF4_GLOPL
MKQAISQPTDQPTNRPTRRTCIEGRMHKHSDNKYAPTAIQLTKTISQGNSGINGNSNNECGRSSRELSCKPINLKYEIKQNITEHWITISFYLISEVLSVGNKKILLFIFIYTNALADENAKSHSTVLDYNALQLLYSWPLSIERSAAMSC